MISSQTVLSQISDENPIGVKETITILLAQKAKVFLEDKRRCLASVMYGACTEQANDCDCSCEDEVQEDCGCTEE